MICAKFGWNWPSGEEDFFKFRQYISAISKWSTLGEGQGPFIWTNLIPLATTHWYFLSSLVEIGLVVLEKKIFKFRQSIFAISSLSRSLLGKGGPFIPFNQGYFVPSLVESGPVILEKKIKCEKFKSTPRTTTTTTTTITTDNGQILIRKAHSR